jgi:hypothetical protein
MPAWQFEWGQPPAYYWMHQLLPVLQHVLADLGLASAREASRLAMHPLALEGAPATVMEGPVGQRDERYNRSSRLDGR